MHLSGLARSWIFQNWFPLPVDWRAESAPIPADPFSYCRPSCEDVFQEVVVYPHVRHGASLISWSLRKGLRLDEPQIFQLQVGRTASSDSDNWVNVGLPIEGVFAAWDDQQRSFGRRPGAHYRVVLAAGTTLYYSRPVSVLGNLDAYWARIYGQIAFLELLRLKNHAGSKGTLLKRRNAGQRCFCVDPHTEESYDPNCRECYGTGWKGGYYAPVDCVWMELGGWGSAMNQNIEATGTNDPAYDSITGRMLAIPMADVYDVWIDSQTDLRYYIRQIRYVASVHSMPLVAQVVLSLLPMDHVIYDYPVENFLAV